MITGSDQMARIEPLVARTMRDGWQRVPLEAGDDPLALVAGLEEAYAERLHPRDRVGRWVRGLRVPRDPELEAAALRGDAATVQARVQTHLKAGHVGTHFSTDHDVALSYGAPRDASETGVMVEVDADPGAVNSRAAALKIDPTFEVWNDGSSGDQHEIPVRPGAPLHVKRTWVQVNVDNGAGPVPSWRPVNTDFTADAALSADSLRVSHTDAAVPLVLFDDPPVKATGNPGPHDEWDKYVPRFDKDVLAVHDQATAEAFFKALGVTAHLDLSQGAAASEPEANKARFYREIAQATKDAFARSPSLKDGTWAPLKGVVLTSNLPPDRKAKFQKARHGPMSEGYWASTGASPYTTNTTWGVPGKQRYNEDARKEGIWITINDAATNEDNRKAIINHMDGRETGQSVALSSIYGRMTHELGHAVDQSGFRFSVPVTQWSEPELELLDKHLTTLDMLNISEYGDSSPLEGWAEVYATLHTPHAMDNLPPLLVQDLHELQAAAVYDERPVL